MSCSWGIVLMHLFLPLSHYFSFHCTSCNHYKKLSIICTSILCLHKNLAKIILFVLENLVDGDLKFETVIVNIESNYEISSQHTGDFIDGFFFLFIQLHFRNSMKYSVLPCQHCGIFNNVFQILRSYFCASYCSYYDILHPHLEGITLSFFTILRCTHLFLYHSYK